MRLVTGPLLMVTRTADPNMGFVGDTLQGCFIQSSQQIPHKLLGQGENGRNLKPN